MSHTNAFVMFEINALLMFSVIQYNKVNINDT